MSKASAAPLGVFSEQRTPFARETDDVTPIRVGASDCPSEPRDYFITKDGVTYAGTHLLLELWQAEGLCDVALAERALADATRAAGATLLHLHVHHFGPNEGVTGIAVLAESHISIHSWPERGFAAVDIFMCGGCDPYKAAEVLKTAYRPDHVSLGEHKRGVLP